MSNVKLKIVKNKTMINLLSLPDELLELIILELPRKDIRNVIYVSKRLYNICKNNKIWEKKKYKGFPRRSGCAKVYDISHIEFDVEGYDEDSSDEEDFGEATISIEELIEWHEDALDIILEKLYELKYDLIRGDLISIYDDSDDDGAYIFDGSKLIRLKYYWNPLTGIILELVLPEELQIINNNIPMYYWNNMKADIFVNYAWFDYSSVKNELLQNVQYSNSVLYTKFTMNDIEYKIFTSNDIDNESIRKRKFIEKLSTNNKLLFEVCINNALLIKL